MKIQDLFLDKSPAYNEVLEVEGVLTLDPNKSITITTNKNIVLTGKLISRPVFPNVHTFRFINIDESKFVGGGMNVLDSDVGLWVMGSGQLDIQGAQKIGWTRAKGSIKAGDTIIPVENASGWQIGDEIVIMPTVKGATNYDERVIRKIENGTIYLDRSTTDHPVIEDFPPAEIINLTRNVQIEGTQGGRSHLFIHNQSKINLSYVSFRHMGPRKTVEGKANSLVTGRYAVHHHHCEEGSRGSVLEGLIIRDSGSHSIVPHGSHGITYNLCATYNGMEDQYWYDLNHSSHDLTFDACIAARLSYDPRALDVDLWAIDTTDKAPSLGANGFLLGRGDGNTIKNCVIVGSVGDIHAKAGYLWPTRSETQPEGVWNFFNNLAHNCGCGLNVWQNTQLNHTNNGYYAYSNVLDGFHGAYQNNYEYEDGKCNGLFEVKAGSGDRMRFIRMQFGEVNYLSGAVGSDKPTLFLDCKWKNWVDKVGETVRGADIVHCEGPVSITGLATEVVRVQPLGGQPYKLTNKTVKTNIAAFAPTIWGKGKGLKGEYFNDPAFKVKVFDRIDAVVGFTDWGNLVHHLITSTKFSVRWTGKIMPQYSEQYTFITGGGGNMSIWINGVKVTGKVSFTAGKWYDIVVEFYNNDDNVRGGAFMMWSSPSLNNLSPGGEIVPRTQLDYISNPEPPANIPPTVNAGDDITITLPVNSVFLNGSGKDVDGTIVKWQWAGKGTLTDADKPVAKASGLLEGDYVFSLTVTDNQGAMATDTVTVYVLPEPVNQAPIVSAGEPEVLQPFFTLNGKASDDGQITKIQWTKLSGPDCTIVAPGSLVSIVSDLNRGEYEFELAVTDDKGVTSRSKVKKSLK